MWTHCWAGRRTKLISNLSVSRTSSSLRGKKVELAGLNSFIHRADLLSYRLKYHHPSFFIKNISTFYDLIGKIIFNFLVNSDIFLLIR